MQALEGGSTGRTGKEEEEGEEEEEEEEKGAGEQPRQQGLPKHDALQSFSRGLSHSFKVCVKSVTLAKILKITQLVEKMKGSPLLIPP